MKRRSFTLIELVIVIIIIGVLATLGLTHYFGYRERALDREAQSNLLLINAAERIARMESNDNFYVTPATQVPPLPPTNAGINTLLRMSLPVGTVANPANWNYTLTRSTVPNDFCAQATRNGSDGRSFHLHAVPTIVQCVCGAC